MEGIRQTAYNFMNSMTSTINTSVNKGFIFPSYTLNGRVTDNWKVFILDCTTVVAVIGFAIAFFTQTTPLLFISLNVGSLSFFISYFYTEHLYHTARSQHLIEETSRLQVEARETTARMQQLNNWYVQQYETFIQQFGHVNEMQRRQIQLHMSFFPIIPQPPPPVLPVAIPPPAHSE